MQQSSDSHLQYFKLYIWTTVRENAAEYLYKSERFKSVFCSIRINENNAVHEVQRAGLIQSFEVFLIDLIIANNEINFTI